MDLYIMQKTATINELAQLIDYTQDIELVSNAVADAIYSGHHKSASLHPADAESNLMLAAMQEVWHDFTGELTKVASLNAMYGMGLHPYQMMVNAIEKVARKRDEDSEDRGIVGWAKRNPVKAGIAGAGIAGGVALGGKSAYDTYQQLKGDPAFAASRQAAADNMASARGHYADQGSQAAGAFYDNLKGNVSNLPGAGYASQIPGKVRGAVVSAGRSVYGGLQDLKNDMTTNGSYNPYEQYGGGYDPGFYGGFAPVSVDEMAYANEIYKRAGYISDSDVGGMLYGQGYFEQTGGWGY